MPNLTTGDTRLIIDTCRRHGALRNQCAYILATARWETAHTLMPVEEAFFLGRKADAYRRKLRYYPWHGRGYVQLTWRTNYERAARELGVDLTGDPTLAMKPGVAAAVLVKGMLDGWFTGKRLGSYVRLKASDYVGARRVVNGTDKAQEIADLARIYDKALRAEGYGVTAPDPPAPPPPDATFIAPADKPASGWAAVVASILAIFSRRR